MWSLWIWTLIKFPALLSFQILGMAIIMVHTCSLYETIIELIQWPKMHVELKVATTELHTFRRFSIQIANLRHPFAGFASMASHVWPSFKLLLKNRKPRQLNLVNPLMYKGFHNSKIDYKIKCCSRYKGKPLKTKLITKDKYTNLSPGVCSSKYIYLIILKGLTRIWKDIIM
jgi:hypothetical protein